GAALIYDQMFDAEIVIDVATVTKLTRNLFIIIIIPFVTYLFFKGKDPSDRMGKEQETLPKWYAYIPLFVIGFLLCACLRTLGDVTLEDTGSAFGLLNPGHWHTFYETSSSFGTTYLLGMAMAGVGLSTNFSMFK